MNNNFDNETYENSPNNSLESEQIILGAIINNNKLFYSALDLKKEDFYYPVHQEIFSVICNLINEGSEVNLIILKTYFPNGFVSDSTGEYGLSYLFKIYGSGAGLLNIRDYADIVRRLRRVRDFQSFIYKYANQFININTDIDQCLVELESSLFQPSRAVKIRSQNQIVNDIIDELKQDLPCFSTGYKKLDNALAGGFYKQKAYCLVAREKTGKTASLGSFSHHLAKQKVKHLYVAVEMGASEIHKRRMAYEINQNPIVFYDQKMRRDSLFLNNVVKLKQDGESYTIYADAAGVVFDDLKRLILSCIKKYNIEVVIVDYLQIISGESKRENKSDFYARVAQWFADITKSENISLITASQENAEGGTRGSKGITAAMDMLLIMKRPDDIKKRERWFEVKESRYTVAAEIGSEEKPSFILPKNAVFLEEYSPIDDYNSNNLTTLFDDEDF